MKKKFIRRSSFWHHLFSPDYSGSAAVMFVLGTVTAMHAASGRTGNYICYDDPRPLWADSKNERKPALWADIKKRV